MNSQVKKWWAVSGSLVLECRWQFEGADPSSQPCWDTSGERSAKGLKNVKGLTAVPDIHGDVEKVGTVQPGEKATWEDLINVYRHLMVVAKTEPGSSQCQVSNARTRISEYKIKHRKLLPNIGKSLFYCESGKTLKKSPWEVMNLSLLEIFKTLLRPALSNLV